MTFLAQSSILSAILKTSSRDLGSFHNTKDEFLILQRINESIFGYGIMA